MTAEIASHWMMETSAHAPSSSRRCWSANISAPPSFRLTGSCMRRSWRKSPSEAAASATLLSCPSPMQRNTVLPAPFGSAGERTRKGSATGPGPPQIGGWKALRHKVFRIWKSKGTRIYPRKGKTDFDLRKFAPHGIAAASHVGLLL